MRLLIFLLLILGNAWADSIYLQHTADLEQRKIKFSFLPNISQEAIIKECSLVQKKIVIHKIDLNLKLSPQKEIKTFDHEFNFPANLLPKVESFDDLKVICDTKVKATGWTFITSKLKNEIPKGWEVSSEKLKVKSGHYQLSSHLSLKAPQIEIAKGTTITMGPGVTLELAGEFLPLEMVHLKGQDRGAVILKSKKDLTLLNVSLEGGKRTDCSLCIWAPKIVLSDVKLQGHDAQYGLKLFATKIELNEVSLSSVGIGALLNASESHLHKIQTQNTKSAGLILQGGKTRISESDFLKSESNLVKCTNNCKLDIQKSILKEAEYGIWADNSSEVDSSNNNFQSLNVALGSYRTRDWWKGSLIKDKASTYSEVKLVSDADEFSKVEK